MNGIARIFIGGPAHGQIKGDFNLPFVKVIDWPQDRDQIIPSPYKNDPPPFIVHHTYQLRSYRIHANGLPTHRRAFYMIHESLSALDAIHLIEQYESQP